PAPPVLARGPGLTEGPDLHDAPRHGVVERAVDRALRGRHPAERAHDVEDAPEVVPHLGGPDLAQDAAPILPPEVEDRGLAAHGRAEDQVRGPRRVRKADASPVRDPERLREATARDFRRLPLDELLRESGERGNPMVLGEAARAVRPAPA